MTQTDLAKIADVSVMTIVRAERGERCTFGVIKKFADALNVEPAALIGQEAADA